MRNQIIRDDRERAWPRTGNGHTVRARVQRRALRGEEPWQQRCASWLRDPIVNRAAEERYIARVAGGHHRARVPDLVNDIRT